MACAQKTQTMEEVQREFQETKNHCYVVITQRDDWHYKHKKDTYELRKIIVGVKKENFKLKKEKSKLKSANFELGIKYHNVDERLLHWLHWYVCESNNNSDLSLGYGNNTEYHNITN